MFFYKTAITVPDAEKLVHVGNLTRGARAAAPAQRSKAVYGLQCAAGTSLLARGHPVWTSLSAWSAPQSAQPLKFLLVGDNRRSGVDGVWESYFCCAVPIHSVGRALYSSQNRATYSVCDLGPRPPASVLGMVPLV